MHDETRTHQERLQRQGHLKGYGVPPSKPEGEPPEGGEGACPAFGYLRGLHERASAIEFRMKNSNATWFPYAWLGTLKFDPSAGLLIKFSGDLIYLVLIRGSNLDRRLREGGIDLIRAGLQRHRVMWVREMSEDDIRQVGDDGPTIDSIEVAEFESHDALKKWLGQHAPAFVS